VNIARAWAFTFRRRFITPGAVVAHQDDQALCPA
jgi:hypothetical protein